VALIVFCLVIFNIAFRYKLYNGTCSPDASVQGRHTESGPVGIYKVGRTAVAASSKPNANASVAYNVGGTGRM